MADEIEPIDPAIWFRRIEMIARGELESLGSSLRHASHLLQLTPTLLRPYVRLSVDEDVFEDLLDRGEFNTAAMHLVAQPAALSVERDADGFFQAAISCVVLGRAVEGKGESQASAVLDAWTTCLLALRAEMGEVLLNLDDQVQHEDRPARHPRSSSH